uniref:WGS project CBMI000000000 data, contig CS3069_c004796 n=1 Tax=Fusarium clavum TaxID=2594811 RepID=A0A090MIW5_9HYPO|nr:unnamed protein product [Fusarium clavum]
MSTTQDPIELGLISERAAQVLYETFFRHFNPTVGLLDPSIYTFQHTRTQSSFLLTVILTVSSRILPPGLYESLRDHAESLLGGALVSCDTKIETVWAIVCMYHWKDADDTRGDMPIGFAARLAASAGWDFAGRDVEHWRNMTEIELRQRMDQRRVCLVLARIDPRLYIPTPALLQEDMNPYDLSNDISTLSGFLDIGDLTLDEGDYTAPLNMDSNVELEALDYDFFGPGITKPA